MQPIELPRTDCFAFLRGLRERGMVGHWVCRCSVSVQPRSVASCSCFITF